MRVVPFSFSLGLEQLGAFWRRVASSFCARCFGKRELIRPVSSGGDLLTLLTAGKLKLCLQSFTGQYEFALLMPTADSELSLFNNTMLS